MIIAIGNDHAGVGVKEKIQQHLISKGHSVINKGYDGKESVDYPDFIHPVSIEVKEKKAEIVNKTALGRVAEPDDIASAAYLLYRSTYMTGQVLKIDGGRSPG